MGFSDKAAHLGSIFVLCIAGLENVFKKLYAFKMMVPNQCPIQERCVSSIFLCHKKETTI